MSFETCVRCSGGIDLGRAAMHVCGDTPERDFTEERLQDALRRGQIDGDKFITATGAVVEMFQDQEGDDELIDPGCVYCEGQGDIESENPFSYESYACSACNGTGKANYKITRGEQRKLAWLDMLFFTDATRAEKMDRDICPDCGCGGCGGECHWTEEDWARVNGPIEEAFGTAPVTMEDVAEWSHKMNEALDQIAKGG